MLAIHLVTVRFLAAAWTAPEVSKEEGSYASRFYRWFSESFKSCLLFLVAPPGLIDTLAQLLVWRSLLWLSMIRWWMYVTQSDFLSTTSLAWSLVLHLLFCFSQEKPLRWKEINTHTHNLLFANYGSRSPSIVKVQVPHSHNQDNHKCYRQRKTNAFNLYTWSYENACSFLEWSFRKRYY